jgi:hypothetical protein
MAMKIISSTSSTSINGVTLMYGVVELVLVVFIVVSFPRHTSTSRWNANAKAVAGRSESVKITR